MDFVHRDLKMENVMVEKYIKEDGSTGMICKLVDFGFATTIKGDAKLSLALGTPLYMAPEIIKGEKYDKAVDVWALGVMTYAMLSSIFPFDGSTRGSMNTKILKS